MKKIIFTVIFLYIPLQAMAYGDYISMKKVKGENIDDSYVQCSYKQAWGGNFTTTIIVKSRSHYASCPNTIQFNPATNKWKKQ